MKNTILLTALFLFCIKSNAQNVGIGEAVPSTKLEIKGDGSDLLNIKDNSNKSKLYIDSDGKVGIGTASPETPLHLYRSEAGAVSLLKLVKHEGDIDDASLINIDFEFLDTNPNGKPHARISAHANTDKSQGSGMEAEGSADLVFSTASAATTTTNNLQERMRIKATGDIQFANYNNGYLQVDGSGNMSTIGTIPSGSITEADPTWSGSATTSSNISRSGNLDLSGSITFTGACCRPALNMLNTDIVDANHITIADAGANEGLAWAGTDWVIDVSPANRGNGNGNLNLYGINNNVIIWRPTGIGGISVPSSVLHVGAINDGISSTQAITVESQGYAGIELLGDRSNTGGEPGGAYVLLSQDNKAVQGIMGMIQIADEDGAGNSFTGTTGNSILLGNKYGGDLHLGTGSSVKMTINSSGNVGIGAAPNNSYKLLINGKFRSNGINETSDARLKKNIKSLDNGLDKIMALRGVSYEWRKEEYPDKGFSEGMELGVLAQEVEKILPEVVDTDDEGYKSVQYSHIVPVLVEAIKEQQLIIEQQKEALELHASEIAQLKESQACAAADNKLEMQKLKAEIATINQYIQMQSRK